jgi:hypothetical protein
LFYEGLRGIITRVGWFVYEESRSFTGGPAGSRPVRSTDVAELEQDLRELAGEAGREQPEVARQAQEAAGDIAGSQLRDRGGRHR